ncbi:MAG: sensor histidine kinase [Clostridia bacterium]|nr:sensor histidine kinase [Clostridia bacterium]
MNLNLALRSILEAAIIMPIGVMALVSFSDKLRFKAAYAITIMLTCFAALSVADGLLRLKFGLNITTITIFAIILMFVFLLSVIKDDRFKVLFVIVTAGTLVSTGALYGYYLEAYCRFTNSYDNPQTKGLILRFAFVSVLLIIFGFVASKIKWLLNSPDFHKTWKILWLVPLTFAIANIVMIPYDYEEFMQGNTPSIYVTITTIQLIMHILFLFMLYFIAKTISEKSKLDKQSQILSIQAAQYEGLQRHIEATSKLRHDFKHTVRTAVSLAYEGETDALIKLLTDYGVATAHTDKRMVFTKSSTLNALICHYYEIALSKSILCDWQVRLPEKLGVEDIDLFGIIGNLLENAIHAAEAEPEENRYINFQADFEDNGDLYIVVTNGFNGEIKKDHDKYLSTKSNGSGIGIESIKSIVKRYNGFAKFYNDEKTFFTDIMIKQNQQ